MPILDEENKLQAMKNKPDDVSISVITATYNAAKLLPGLLDSLLRQTDQRFEWIVVDGASSDNTVEIIESCELRNVKLISEKDCGIYDALNKGVEIASGNYYLVVGADDILFPNAVSDFRKAASLGRFDFIASKVVVDERIVEPKSGKGWLKGLHGETSGHAVSLLIRRSLHKRYGLYKMSYRICADQHFVLSALNAGAAVDRVDFISGKYSLDGFSGQDILGSLLEGFRVRVSVYGFNLTQFSIFILKLLKNYSRIKKSFKCP